MSARPAKQSPLASTRPAPKQPLLPAKQGSRPVPAKQAAKPAAVQRAAEEAPSVLDMKKLALSGL